MKTVERTDIGNNRTVNEDRVAIKNELNGFTMALVADGMGGHQAGDRASQMAVEIIQEQLNSLHLGLSIEQCEELMSKAILHANERIFQYASTRSELKGMGTTVVLAVATSETVIIAHIGDSRAYKISGSSIIQLTEDHSLVAELVKSGQITAEEALHHPRRNVLTRALGTEPTVAVDVKHISWEKNDLLLLCSDGLSGSLDNQQMLDILQSEQDLESKADHLVARALQSGGEDNITLVLLANEGNDQEMGWNG